MARSVRTLAIRMEQHAKSAMAVAEFLSAHPLVEKVLYPGLPSHPQHELAKRQMLGFSGMVSFYIRGGRDEARKFLQTVKIFALAESLGGFESLVESPSLMTHLSVPEDMRNELGITDNLIRISVGLEDAKDLIEDLQQALTSSCNWKKKKIKGAKIHSTCRVQWENFETQNVQYILVEVVLDN